MGHSAGVSRVFRAERMSSRLGLALLGGSILSGVPGMALASAHGAAPMASRAPVAASASPVVAPAMPVPAAPQELIRSIAVEGSQRLEADTVMSYTQLRVGQPYTETAADQALKDLYATELFSDVQIRNDAGKVVMAVKENPVINRIVLEGNKHLKEDKINPEIKLAARQIFTRSKVRADVTRIIELYKREGRFGAEVEPKMVQLDQNRVDIIFEISEGPKSKVRKINILGAGAFSDKALRGAMMTHEARPLHFFRSGTSYDPDRMAYDQQKLRQFYLTNGYADFRVVSAVAELTPDKHDFIITYVVEEGKRYKFGDLSVASQLRDLDGAVLTKQLPLKKGAWYNAKAVEDTIDKLNSTAGGYGYAFADVRPSYKRDAKAQTMGVEFQIGDAPRVYVERIDVNGNTLTQDKVIRREFRVAEGDAFNAAQVKRSTNRIKGLGYFQEKFEVEQKSGSAKDRVVLEANVEEKPTGELQLSAGYSSLESFIFQASIQQHNFRGRGQTVGLSGSLSRYSKSVDLAFTEPYLFDRNVSFGFDIYRRDYNNSNTLSTSSSTLYTQATTGAQLRLGLPLTEYVSLVGRYTFNYDDVSLNHGSYYTQNTAGVSTCNPLLAGRYLCESEGKRTSSIVGSSLIFENLDNRQHPSKGKVASVGVDFAGLGGDVEYGRLRFNAAEYWPLGKGFIFSISGEGGAIKALKKRYGLDFANNSVELEGVFLTDRFYLGEPQIRGFDIRGVGPRVIRKPLVAPSSGVGALVPTTDKTTWTDDAIGGDYYYMGRAELEIPLGAGAKDMGLRPSIFMDTGAVWGVTSPLINPPGHGSTQVFPVRDAQGNPLYTQVANGVTTSVTSSVNTVDGHTPNTPQQTTIAPFQEFYYGNSMNPRLSVGFGVNWNSPFGPFRLDFAKTLLHEPGDNVKSFTFNVGTQF